MGVMLLLLLLLKLRIKLPKACARFGTLAFAVQDVLDRMDGTASILIAVWLTGIALIFETNEAFWLRVLPASDQQSGFYQMNPLFRYDNDDLAVQMN